MLNFMPFTFKQLSIPDVILVQPKSFSDDRGFFLESFKESDFVSNGINIKFVQDNISHSVLGVIRGLHFQKKCVETILAFKKRGKAIIFVSHDMGVIQKYADRVMFLNKGKAEKIGPPVDVVTYYGDFCRARDKLDDSSNK